MAAVKRYLGVVPARRRAMALLLFGLVYVIYGVGLYVSPAPGAIGPRWWPGVLFVVAGLVTLISALMDRPHNEWVGFTTLYVTSIIWALNFLVLIVIDQGVRAWSGLLVWALVTLLLLLLAGWAEPPPKDVMDAVNAYVAAEERRQADDAAHNGSAGSE